MITIQNDIVLIFNVLSELFRSFFDKETLQTFDSESYFKFTGIKKEQVNDIYNRTAIKDILPYDLNPYEVLIVLTVTGTFYHPDIFRGLRYVHKLSEESFSIFGGKIKGDNKCFYPTGETLLFILAGHDISLRMQFEELLNAESNLFKFGLLDISHAEEGTPRLTGQVFPTAELITILNGKVFRPEYTSNFPASRIETKMEWEDLVLPYETYEELEELTIWMKHGQSLLEHKDLGKRIKPGYRTLFYGPPGTGKTLTASLIGKAFGVDVYRIDLSMVVSKWVGETEKNLKGIFDQASNKNWILFFDEADSLFGKRTQANSANDRHANQEVSYLLQRIEDFPGLVILASNLKSNLDEAFNRRFQSTIYYPMPDSEIRYKLWEKAFPKDFTLENRISLNTIAQKYELAGGSIINIVRYCVLKAMDRQTKEIALDDIEHSIIREFKKEGKIVG